MAVVELQQLNYVAVGAVRDGLSSFASISLPLGDLNLFLSSARLHKASTQFLIQEGPHSETVAVLGEPRSGAIGC